MPRPQTPYFAAAPLRSAAPSETWTPTPDPDTARFQRASQSIQPSIEDTQQEQQLRQQKSQLPTRQLEIFLNEEEFLGIFPRPSRTAGALRDMRLTRFCLKFWQHNNNQVIEADWMPDMAWHERQECEACLRLGGLFLLAGRRRAWLSLITWMDVESWMMGPNT